MQRPDSKKSPSRMAAGRVSEEPKDLPKQIGNYRGNAARLKQAIVKTAREYLKKSGKTEQEMARMAPELAPPSAWIGMPTTGSVKIFALLIEFTDTPHTNDKQKINAALFGSPATGAPYESLAAYYQRSSYGKLDLSKGSTLGWYKVNKKRADIPQTTAGREAVIKEALLHFKSQGHDFTQYDNDHSGVIDYFMVFWAGADNGWGNFWWGYQTEYSDNTFKLDGLRLGSYSWQWEGRPVGTAFSPRVAIHETGHALGLPDLYDYDDNVGPDGGVGGLDMMDANYADHNCFSKWMLDWLTPTIVSTGKKSVKLRPSSETGDCIVMWPGLDQGELFGEYFMIQNRHRTKNDTQLPADGVLIWHVDARLNSAGSDFIYNNSFTPHKLVRLMEADGLEEIEVEQGANAGDFYAVNQHFGRATAPSSARYDGSPSWCDVNIESHTGSDFTVRCEFKCTSDLVIAGLTATPNPARAGKPIRFDVTVKNIGTEAALKTEAELAITPLLGGVRRKGRYVDVPALAPGETVKVTTACILPVSSGLKPSAYMVMAAADAKKDMPEENEYNNNLGIKVRVLPKLPPMSSR